MCFVCYNNNCNVLFFQCFQNGFTIGRAIIVILIYYIYGIGICSKIVMSILQGRMYIWSHIIFYKILHSSSLLVSYSRPLRQWILRIHYIYCLAAPTSVVFDVVVVGNNKDCSGLSHKKYTWMLNTFVYLL